MNTDELVFSNVAQTEAVGKKLDGSPPYLPSDIPHKGEAYVLKKDM